MVSPLDPGYEELIDDIFATMRKATEMNTGYRTPEEVHEFMAEILGKPLPRSTTVLPPFYVDYGRPVRIGEDCFIQQGCTFFGRCGITIGNGVFIGPKVNLITINHDVNPVSRAAIFGVHIVMKGCLFWRILHFCDAGFRLVERFYFVPFNFAMLVFLLLER